jgi:carboxylesterase
LTKDLQERNNLVRLGLIVAIMVLLLSALAIFTIDYELLRNPNNIGDHHIKTVLMGIAIFLSALVMRRLILSIGHNLNRRYLSRFDEIKDLGVYKESNSTLYNPNKKLDHAVLLLHGFTASPQEFELLYPMLKEENICYFAPNIIGFGSNNTDILERARYEDWFRSAILSYDNLKLLAHKVSIVGHSMGGILGTFVAMNRPVHKLVLSGPGLYPAPTDIKYKKILLMPFMSRVYSWCVPMLPKPIREGRTTTSDTLDDTLTARIFQYLAIPVQCVTEIFKAQDKVDLAKANFEQLHLIYGAHDMTVDNQRLIKFMQQHDISFSEHRLERSAHNSFEDFDRNDSIEILRNILSSNSSNQESKQEIQS